MHDCHMTWAQGTLNNGECSLLFVSWDTPTRCVDAAHALLTETASMFWFGFTGRTRMARVPFYFNLHSDKQDESQTD